MCTDYETNPLLLDEGSFPEGLSVIVSSYLQSQTSKGMSVAPSSGYSCALMQALL